MNCLSIVHRVDVSREGALLTLNRVGRQQCGCVVWTGQSGRHGNTETYSAVDQLKYILLFFSWMEIIHP